MLFYKKATKKLFKQVHVNDKVGLSALSVLKPFTSGEVAAAADGEGNLKFGQSMDACPYKCA